MSLQETVNLVNEFRTLVQQRHIPTEKCNEILSKLKIAMTKFSFPETILTQEQEKQQLLLCREILENAALFAIQTKDVLSFERNLAQLKTYYYDYEAKLPPSQLQFPLLGLNLLRLLAKNKLDEFHTELELIPMEKQTGNIYIKHPVQLEQFMMEGAYNKVLKASTEAPSENYSLFMDMLMETVRDEIADCLKSAYNSMSLVEAQKVLALPNLDVTKQYAERKEWKIENKVIQFKKEMADGRAEIPALNLIQQTLHYARELERIV